MSIFFANFKVILLSPEEFIDPSLDIEAKRDDLGGYTLLVDRGGENFQNIFGEQRWFTKKERQQIKLFVIGEFLKRHIG